MSHYTRVVLLCCLSIALTAGIFVTRREAVVFSSWWLLCLVPVIFFFKNRTFLGIFLLCIAGFLVGLQRGGHMQAQLARYRQWYGRTVVIEGRIRDDPAYDDKHRLDFRIDHVRLNGYSLPGQVRIRALSGSARRGDIVRVSGRLQSGFGNYQAAVSYTKVQILHANDDPFDAFRQRFFVGVYNALPDPQASLGLGFLVGLKTQLSSSLQDQLQALALTHIVVASGYNLTIVIRLARRLLARYSKFQAFAGAWLLLCGMLLITGMSPSMARAAVVTGVALTAWYFGRKVHPIVLLLGSAAATAWWNPLQPWSDLGWWLSFLAFAGVLIVAPLLTARWYGSRSPPLIMQVAIETLAAQLLVEPLIVWVFGQVSVLGLLANILVVPWIPLAMLLTLFSGIAGVWWVPMAGWVAWPCWVILSYITQMVHLLAGVPWAMRKVSLSMLQLGIVYACLGVVVFAVRHRTTYSFREGRNIVE